MFSYEIKVPKDRVAVLIGKKGEVKRRIERFTKTKITVDSQEGNVTIESEDSFAAFNTQIIVKAIARGFNPNIALLLKKETFSLEIIDMTDFVGKSKRKMHRFKARLIGTHGKAWKTLERLTKCHLSVYGKTVGIIGPAEEVALARQAVEDLLKGAPHGHVYNYVKDIKKKDKLGLR